MATGVKPRDENSQLTRSDLEAIQEAMKNQKFRDMLSDYCEEVRDPANQAIYQKEMTQLEKERGYDITFINPKGGYVIKTSVAGDRKAFINICSNENVGKPSCSVQEVNGHKGMSWQLPYSLIPPREDYNHKKEKCVVYDVVFHPDTLRMAEVNKRFREIVNKTAFDGLQNTYDIHLDSNNCKFPRSHYKGMAVPAVIRKEDPNYEPPTEEETQNMSSDLLDNLYPQHVYSENDTSYAHIELPQKRKPVTNNKEFTQSSEKGYTVPKYIIKQQKAIDFQDYTYHKDSKQYTAIPNNLVIEINLPLLSSTTDCVLDVREKSLSLLSEKPAKYRLYLTLPYSVNEECGHAKFDKAQRKLIVTLPVIKKQLSSENANSVKVDSGLESEENSGSQSEDDVKENHIEELSSSEASSPSSNSLKESSDEKFLLPSIGYALPSYTHNVLDDSVAFTFHVRNTELDSVKVKNVDNKVFIKFTSLGSGFVPVHYAAILVFDKKVVFTTVCGEAWDNNVILQLEVSGDIPHTFQIGLNEGDFKEEYFDIPEDRKLKETLESKPQTKHQDEVSLPVIEVTNLGSETNIVVSSNSNKYDEDFYIEKERDIAWTESHSCESGAKSILRKPLSIMRSFSESSTGDVASSMDYISSDCIPEESSLKKTVRFNDVIARQFYRYNSSIEGQKKKNQRKKSKKRTQDRRRSESEAEDDGVSDLGKTSNPRLKSVLKQRRDSGLADTSDAENDYKNTPTEKSSYDSSYIDENANENYKSSSKSNSDFFDNNGNSRSVSKNLPIQMNEGKKIDPITCDNIKHNTNLYNPDKLNKGQYQEVTFKNDLIFELDM